MSLLRRMTAFGVRFIYSADAGIAASKGHCGYAEAVIELGQLTGNVPALVAASSSACGGRARPVEGRLRRGFDTDVLVVDGTRPPTSPPCGMCARSCSGCVGLITAGRESPEALDRDLTPGATLVVLQHAATA